MLNAILNRDWSNSVPGRQLPKGPKTTNVANQLAVTSGEAKTLIIEPLEDLSGEHRTIKKKFAYDHHAKLR